MEGPARTRLVALVVLLAVAVPLGVIAIAGSGAGDEPEQGGLRVERSTELPELLLYVQPGANTSDRAGGRDRVTIECRDRDGGVVVSTGEPWPFTDTDEGTLDPHAHVPVSPARINDVQRCRLRQTEPLLEAAVG